MRKILIDFVLVLFVVVVLGLIFNFFLLWLDASDYWRGLLLGIFSTSLSNIIFSSLEIER